MEKANNYVYEFENRLYVNLTNKCHNHCTFCVRNKKNGIAQDNLWLEKEPTTAEVMEQLSKYDGEGRDVVFCGYGEPTERLAELIEVATLAKQLGFTTRLNTNGLGSALAGEDITPNLVGIIDTISVSLNQCDNAKYLEVTQSEYGLEAFDYLLSFVERCVDNDINTVLTIVDSIDILDILACQRVAAMLGVDLRIRKNITGGEEKVCKTKKGR